ncbi:MAG: alkaline shock response membrane anchor protein AmaP [bacterium]
MRYFNRIIIIINTALFLFVGAMFVAVSSPSGANKWLLSTTENVVKLLSPETPGIIAINIAIFFSGLFFIFIALFTIFGNIEKRRSERTVVLESPLGEILVSLGAIEDFSRVVKNQINGVKDIKGKVISTRKGLRVTARVTLYSDRSVADVTQEIQEAIIKYIQFTLGIDNEIKPIVIVSKVVFRQKEETK